MLSWLRCFPHDAMQRKARAATTSASASSSFRRKKSTPQSRDRITRCATTTAAPARQSFGGENVISARAFSFGELAAATGNFGEEKVIGEGGFGRVYRGTVEGSPVAVKQLERGGGDGGKAAAQGNREFAVEVLVLTGLLHHPNLVRLLGYCADGGHRLLVYRLMPLGSLHDHLHGLKTPPLPWRTRMRIAHGAACGLRHLHDAASPPVIYRDLKPSNILLDHGYVARLSDFGLAKLLGPNAGGDGDAGDEKQGTHGYCAPEYLRSGRLTVKSDVYSFGVVLLELITGRPAMGLVGWAAPLIGDQARFQELLDPLLLLRPSARELNQAVAVAAMCLQEDVSLRPVMADVVMALAFLALASASASATTT